MAARSEILSELKTKIASGNVSDAYRTFEELPVVDQIAVSIAPGIGDVLAAYEVKEFGSRAKTNVQDKDYLGAAGNTGLQVLSGISLIPLFRFLRGAKAVTKSGAKAVDVPPSPRKTPSEPLQLAPPKEPKVELPKVEPFQPKGIAEIQYNVGDNLALSSKARKWINGIEQNQISTLGKKVQELPVEQWVKRLEDSGIPKGELRLLKILDESNSIHPKLLNEAAESKKISRGFIDDYMSRSQRDAIQVRNVGAPDYEAPGRTPDSVQRSNEMQKTYFVRGSGENRTKPDHYSKLRYNDGLEGDQAYVFDAVGSFKPGARYEKYSNAFAPGHKDIIAKALKELDILDADGALNNEMGDVVGDNVFRLQSDFQGEVADTYLPKARIARSQTADILYSLGRIPKVYSEANTSFASNLKDVLRQNSSQARNARQNLRPEFLDAMRYSDDTALKKYLGPDLYKTYVDDTLGVRTPGQFFAPLDDEIVEDILRETTGTPVSSIVFIERIAQKNLAKYPIDSARIKTLDYEMYNDYFNASLFKERASVQTDPSMKKLYEDWATGIESLGTEKEIKQIISDVIQRTKNIDAINAKIIVKSPSGFVEPAKQKEILKKLKEYNYQVDQTNKAITDGADIDVEKIANALDLDAARLGIDEFTISPRDIERITGKPFTESLNRTPDEIYNMTSGKLGGRQKYFDAGPRVEDRVNAYFDDLAKIPYLNTFPIKNGVDVLKRAVSINAKDLGMKVDPYFDGGKSQYHKLPVRTNILKSHKQNKDLLFIGDQQAASEGLKTDTIKAYESGQKEIKKVLQELGVNEKGTLTTIKNTGTEFDGTYLKFTDELKDAIEKQGINAFKDGGPVDIDKMLAEL